MKRCLEKCPREKSPPEKCLPRKLPLGKLFYQIFVAFNIILQFLIFKLFIVTSFRGVSRTPVVSMIDLLVTVVNGSNQCHKKLQFRCCVGHRFTSEFVRWSFSKIFSSKVHSSASDTRQNCENCEACLLQIIAWKNNVNL